MTPPAIAAAQTEAVRGDVATNAAQHVRLVRAAAAEGAELVLFPELSLTGYELDLADALAFGEADPRLDLLRAVCAEERVTLVAGAPVRLAGRLHVGALVLAPDGAVEVYTKRRLGAFPSDANAGGPVPPAEASVFAPGDRDPLVHVGGVAAAIAVCADVGSAEHAARAAARGARAYLASMFVIPADLEQEEARLRDRAVRHGMTVVLANHGAPTGGLPSAGRSAIWSERGEVLARLPVSGTGLALASGRTIAPA